MPDLDRRVLHGLAGRGVDDGEAKRERDTRPTLRDVAPHGGVVDVVRPLGLLGREDAGDETRRDPGRTRSSGLGFVCVEEPTGSPDTRPDGARGEPAELGQGTQAAERTVVATCVVVGHGGSVRRTSKRRLRVPSLS
jgi:hypothetical protein